LQEAKDFEESLLRLAQLAKSRVRLLDFTQKDKYHLLDLFVNNEQTLLKIYEALFPHRSTNAYPTNHQDQQTAPSSPMGANSDQPRVDTKSSAYGNRMEGTFLPIASNMSGGSRRQPFSQNSHQAAKSLMPSSAGYGTRNHLVSAAQTARNQ